MTPFVGGEPARHYDVKLRWSGGVMDVSVCAMARDVSLADIPRHELVAAALELGMERPERLGAEELADFIRAANSTSMPPPPPPPQRSAPSSSWLSVARNLVASVMEQGLNLPEAARVIRATVTPVPRQRPPLPTVTLAQIYLTQKHTERARTTLTMVLQREPDNFKAQSLLARLNAELREQQGGGPRDMSEPPPSGEPTADESAALIQLSLTLEAVVNASAAASSSLGATVSPVTVSPVTASLATPLATPPSDTASPKPFAAPPRAPFGASEAEVPSIDPAVAARSSSQPGVVSRSISPPAAATWPASVVPSAAVAVPQLVIVRAPSGDELCLHWELPERSARRGSGTLGIHLQSFSPSPTGVLSATRWLPVSEPRGQWMVFAGKQVEVRAFLGERKPGGALSVLVVASNHIFEAQPLNEGTAASSAASSGASLGGTTADSALAAGGAPALVVAFRPSPGRACEAVAERALLAIQGSPKASSWVGVRT